MVLPGTALTETDDPYHHGSVPVTAIDAALETIRADGSDALRVRDLARQIGVTHTALYRHFSNRSGLLDAVAARWISVGEQRFASTESYTELLSRYVDWALESEHLYRCVFNGSHVGGSAANAAITRLQVVVAARYRDDFGGETREVRDGVFVSWGLVHGLLDLYWQRLLRAATPLDAAAYINVAVTWTVSDRRG